MQKVLNFGWKTLWEKGKLLVTSNFSFSNNVFKILIDLLQTRKNQGLFGKGLIGQMAWDGVPITEINDRAG